MQVSVEETGGLERRMTVEIPGEKIEQEVQKRLQQLSRTASLKGFRPGKVPMKVVNNRFGGQVRQEVLGDMVQSSFYEAVAQEKLRLAGQPAIEPKEGEDKGSFEYTATFEVVPEVEAVPVAGVEFERKLAEVTDADLETMIEKLRVQNADWVANEGEAQGGDRLSIDFVGTIEGEPFKGNEGKDFSVIIGSNQMIEGFELGLIGTKAGEEKSLELLFPENYGVADLAGKPVQFVVNINKVESPQLPELNDEFAAKFGVEEGGIDALRTEVKNNMERELKQTLSNINKRAVMDKLLELNKFDIPQAMIDNEAQHMAQQMSQGMQQSQIKDLSIFNNEAARRVSLGLIIASIIKANDLKVDEEQVRSYIEDMAASYEDPAEVVKWYFEDRSRLSQVEPVVLEEQVVNWILEQGTVKESQVAFEEIMNRQS